MPIILVAVLIGGVVGYLLKGGVQQAPKPPDTEMIKETAVMAQKGTKEWKMQNAESAATDAVSKDATIMDWPEKDGAEMATLRKGTNDWTCLPDYPASPGNDPMCVDKQGMLWMQSYLTQKAPNLAQAGIGYMLQGGSDASNTEPYATKPADGQDWITAPAHIMVFPVGKLDATVYGTDYKKGTSWIMYAGTPYEHLMVPVK